MIKRLRIKFVCVIMAIVVIMLATILGVVIFMTSSNMEMQSINMMRTIAASPFQQGNLGIPSQEVRLPFFSVQISSRGELISASGGYFDLSDREFLQTVVNTALSADDEIGEIKDYDLRYLKAVSLNGYQIIFSDTTAEKTTLTDLIKSSLLIFAAATLVFLGIAVLLSYWVIKPVADAWNQQRQFVADASHELKTPLSVILANTELMHNEEIPREDQQRFLKGILTMTCQMRNLVENMLELARVDSGTLKMRFETVNLSQLVNDALLTFQVLFEEKPLDLNAMVQDGIHVHGSEQHLYQVLEVLLDNALKYSAQPGTVTVNLQASGKYAYLRVVSPGEMLSPEERKNIFKRFYRADKARAMNGSYGLGLAIAETVVEIHKGRIWAESEPGYNIFHVQLPLSSVQTGM
ncbi:MAG: HAMP domain-containing histidine kinase [Oscillospiraceae bacterium]|nr:HAMP domain-containing histidine kinase [Oscillospiraceae bacterium]